MMYDENIRYLNTLFTDHKIFTVNDKNRLYVITKPNDLFIDQVVFATDTIYGVTEADLLEIVYDKLVQQMKQVNDGDIDMAIQDIDDALYRLKMKTARDKLGNLDLAKLRVKSIKEGE